MKSPVFFKNVSKTKLNKLLGQKVKFLDQYFLQTSELSEVLFPHLRDYSKILKKRKIEYKKVFEGHAFYCYLPWRNVCIKLLKEDLFNKLRTARNRDLITEEEQDQFRGARVAIAGLSVGSNVAKVLTLQGGPKRMNLADYDNLGLSNLNRIFAGVHDLGRKKTDVLAENLYETNPYLKLSLFSAGVNSKNVNKFFHINKKNINILVEEVDNLQTKMILRKMAVRKKIPVISITDNSDGIIIEVERYDHGYSLKKFEKKVQALKLNKLNDATIQKKAIQMAKFVGIKHTSSRMLGAILRVGQSLYSWPQLGGAAVLAGVAGAYCVRQIACGRNLKSGTYKVSLADLFEFETKEDKRLRGELLDYFK